MKLKVNIWRKKNVVVAEIVHQCDSLRAKDARNIITLAEKPFVDYKGIKYRFAIMSDDSPSIQGDTFYICGYNRKEDKKVGAFEFLTNEDAILWSKHITDLIDKINGEQEDTPQDFIKIR